MVTTNNLVEFVRCFDTENKSSENGTLIANIEMLVI